MKIPNKYVVEDDYELYNQYTKEVQLERWVEDLQAGIELMTKKLEEYAKSFTRLHKRNEVLRSQYAHKALQYDTKCKECDILITTIESLNNEINNLQSSIIRT